jgi:hypothetical protein
VASLQCNFAYGGLLGTKVSLRGLAQSTASSVPVIISFERTVIVSSDYIEYPDVASLSNPGAPIPPGFSGSLVDVAIDLEDSYLTIDFDNSAPATRFASGYQNTYIFRFDSTQTLVVQNASIDATVTTLGLQAGDITVSGNELFVNVESLRFNTATFVKIDLDIVQFHLPGDYNTDGSVDLADYTVWRDNFGGPAGSLPNDTSGSAIGSQQYRTWQTNFGRVRATDTQDAMVIPEPPSAAMLFLILLFGANTARVSLGVNQESLWGSLST